MSDKKNKTDNKLDPLNELDEFEEYSSIEIEKDPLDELERLEEDSIPDEEEDSDAIIIDPKILEETKKDLESNTKENNVSKNIKKQSNIPKSGATTKISPKTNNKIKDTKVSDEKIRTNNTTTKVEEESSSSSSSKDKVIDNVKVDEDGVPLLNQFDSNKIKNRKIFHKISLSRHGITQILLICAGVIITIFGVLQSLNDVLKISDNVMYGEHQTFAVGLIFIGIVLIISAFYKEIMGFFDMGDLNKLDSNSGQMPKPKDKDEKE